MKRINICVFLLFIFCLSYTATAYNHPENRKDTVLADKFINKIDSVAKEGILKKAYPGCQIFVSVNGKVLYKKSFGNYTYDKKQVVADTDLYDIASLTKICATTLCIMKLYDERKIGPDEKLSKYLPYLVNSNKENITIREVMTHQAGLKSWVPFYKRAIVNNKPDPKIFSNRESAEFSEKVAKDLYMRNDYRDTIYKEITNSEVSEKKKYLYSDLGFYLLADMIQKITGEPLDEFAKENFYKPMGLNRIGFCPLKTFTLSEIVPTENDTVFRKQLVRGYVHDPGAAMLGGVSGHAGLFADATDLGALMQMLLQKGKYKGRKYLKPETVKEFTAYQYPENGNRRGLGFDKPPLKTQNSKLKTQNSNLFVSGPCSSEASENSFGHTGFTGTFIWVDPDYELVYVFLSNRVNPDENNKKLAEMNIRTNIQQLIYKALIIK